MFLRVEDPVWEIFPELVLGLVWADGLDNTGAAADVQAEKRRLQQTLHQRYERETLSQQPRIRAWRQAYSLFGAKPKKYRSSVESLYRMILMGKELRSINPVVDIYNLISLKHMVPAGGDDLDRVEGHIRLTRRREGKPLSRSTKRTRSRPNRGK